MLKKLILQDLLGVWLLLTGCFAVGLVVNETRAKPLPLVYSDQQARLQQSVEKIASSANLPIALDGDVDREEMQKVSATKSTLILDARPEIFYRLGHIPSALSLPRDDFENRYQVLQGTLTSHRDKALIVYCSSSDCHDSQMVAEALQKLGYPHVRIFRGGWSDWGSASLPEEKE